MPLIRPPKPIPPEPEVEPGIIRRAANTGLGGIAAVGNLLDIPGSMVRDTLSFRNPLDQLLTPFSPDNRTSGRDMLRALGLIGKRDTWLNLVPSIATEIALDPLTYGTLGTTAALGAGGKAARAAGILHLAPEVATARGIGKVAGGSFWEGAKSLTHALRTGEWKTVNPAGETVTKPLVEQAAKAGISPSGVPLPGVGPRMARTKMSLSELVEGLPEKLGAGGGPAVLREQAIKNLDNYARKVHKLDYETFMARHGQETLSGHGALGLPFGESTPFVLPDWTKIDRLNAHLDTAGEYLRWSAPGRAVSYLFNHRSGGQWSYEGQKLAGKTTDATELARARANDSLWRTKQQIGHLSHDFQDAFKGTSALDPITGAAGPALEKPEEINRLLDRMIRMSYEVNPPAQEVSSVMRLHQIAPPASSMRVPLTIRDFKPEKVASLESEFADLYKTGGQSLLGGTANPLIDRPYDVLLNRHRNVLSEMRRRGSIGDAELTSGWLPDVQLFHDSQHPNVSGPEWRHNMDALVDAGAFEKRITNGVTEYRPTANFDPSSMPQAPGHEKALLFHLQERSGQTHRTVPSPSTGPLFEDVTLKSIARKDRVTNVLEKFLPEGHAGRANADLHTRMSEIINDVHAIKDKYHADLVDSGVSIGTIGNDLFAHLPRYPDVQSFEEYEHMMHRAVPLTGQATKPRTPEISHLPEVAVQWLVKTPELRQMKAEEAGPIIEHTLREYLPATEREGKQVTGEKLHKWLMGTSPDFVSADASSEIAGLPSAAVEWLTKHPQLRRMKTAEAAPLIERTLGDALQGTPVTGEQLHKWLVGSGKNRVMYGNSVASDLSDYLASISRIVATRDAAFHTLLGAAEDVASGALHPSVKTVPLHETLTGMGFGSANDVTQLKAIMRLSKMGGHTDLSKVREMQIPEEVHNAVTGLWNTITQPKQHGPLLFWFDKATQFIKGSLTLPWPAFSVRNATSAQLWNHMSDVMQQPGAFGVYNKNLSLAREMLGDPAKYDDLFRELHAQNVFQYGTTPADLNALQHSTDQMRPPKVLDFQDIRSAAHQEMQQKGSTLIEHALRDHPQAQAVASSVINPVRTGYNIATEAGKRAAALGEWYGRVPMYMTLRDMGWSPEMAARKVGELQVDYGKLSPFEKNTMRRLVPFYTFTKKIGQNMLQQLTEHPHGITSVAGTIKNLNRLRNPGELLPDYVAETASIPLGGDEEGNRHYITGFGLPFEDPLSFFGKGIRGGLLEGLSRTNPMVKGPLEYATGELFFQSGPNGGRELADADPLIGRTISNILGKEDAVRLPELVEVAAANSPLSRAISSTRQLFDPRKPLLTRASNLLTGVRISTVSPAASDALLRDAVQQELRQVGSRQFVRSYIPEYRKQDMTPTQLASATRLETALNTLAKRAKRRKELKEAELAPQG